MLEWQDWITIYTVIADFKHCRRYHQSGSVHRTRLLATEHPFLFATESYAHSRSAWKKPPQQGANLLRKREKL